MTALLHHTATTAAALALLSERVSDSDQVAADLHESLGDASAADGSRDELAWRGMSERELKVDPEHVSPILRTIPPWRFLVAVFGGDEAEQSVVGHLFVGVFFDDVAEQCFGSRIVSWSEVLAASYKRQQAAAMMILATIRRTRNASAAYQEMRALGLLEVAAA